jgi:hypothetical protein
LRQFACVKQSGLARLCKEQIEDHGLRWASLSAGQSS